MKFSKLLVLSALWLAGLGANAANLNERVAPETPDFTYFDDVELINKTAVDFVVGDCYVLYNKGAEKYYFEGNAWGTQATGSIDSGAREISRSAEDLSKRTEQQAASLEETAAARCGRIRGFAGGRDEMPDVFG